MNLSRCANGHFFDRDKFLTCPHCKDGADMSDNNLTSVFVDDFVPSNEPGERSEVEENQFTVKLEQNSGDSVTVPLNQQMPSMDYYGGGESDDDHTVGFFDNDFFGVPAQPAAAPQNQDVWAQQTGQQDMGAQQPASRQPTVPGQQPVSRQIIPEKPVEMRPANKVSTPCVGWLIALNGEHMGTDFRLKVGKNFIGRSPQMDIALTEDKSVSREKHAIVVYEPKAHIYMMQPGESSSLVYKNDELVLSPVKIEAYDKISVGDVELLFMPLCGEHFNWSDWFKKIKQEKE